MSEENQPTNEPTNAEAVTANINLEVDAVELAERIHVLVSAEEPGPHRDFAPEEKHLRRTLGGASIEAAIRTEAQRVGLTDADLEKHGRALADLLEVAAGALERNVAEMAADLARNAVRRLKASLLEQAARG